MFALSLLLLTAAPAQLSVVVPNFNVIDVSPETGAFFMDRLANRLRHRGLRVSTATEIESVLGLERQRQLMGCAEDSSTCQAEIASALGADSIVRARVARFGNRFELSLTMIDTVNAAVLASFTRGVANESQVLEALDAAADELSEKLSVAKAPKTAVSRPAWVPVIPLAVGVGAGIAGAVLLSESYRKVPLINEAPNFEMIAAEAKLDRGLGLALVGVGAAGLATAAILFFTGRAPVATPVAVLSSNGAWVGVEGRLP